MHWVRSSTSRYKTASSQSFIFIIFSNNPTNLHILLNQPNSNNMSATKLILAIGATGAQGQVVVEALLAPDAHGNPSPYSVRALTRDPTSKHALELTAQGVECVKGGLAFII
jgi:hypothetical protein